MCVRARACSLGLRVAPRTCSRAPLPATSSPSHRCCRCCCRPDRVHHQRPRGGHRSGGQGRGCAGGQRRSSNRLLCFAGSHAAADRTRPCCTPARTHRPPARLPTHAHRRARSLAPPTRWLPTPAPSAACTASTLGATSSTGERPQRCLVLERRVPPLHVRTHARTPRPFELRTSTWLRHTRPPMPPTLLIARQV